MAEFPIFVSVIFNRHYLADYIIHYYGEHPIKLDAKSRIYPFISRFITPAPIKFKQVKPGPGLVTFELPYNEVQDVRRLNFIHPRSYSSIQTYFYNLFHANFILYMNNACISNDIPYKDAIITFMDINELTFDKCQYDSLKRIYLRHRKQVLKNKYFVKNFT